MASPRIIPIFLPYQGCRQRCIYCNEKIATGVAPGSLSEETLQKIMALCADRSKPDSRPVQIAFYGGTFTGMAAGEQIRLLRMVQPFLREGRVNSLRISTRPDEIDEDNLDLLRLHGVKTVEIGAQSLVEDVLCRSRRGHSVDDVLSAVKRLRRKGFEIGIHLMAGLPGDSRQSFATTIERTCILQPDTVRLHPTLVFRDTALEALYNEGRYSPLSLSEAVLQSRYALLRLEKAGIAVIRIGLQTTPEMEIPGNVVAGPFSPALRSLVNAGIFREMASIQLSAVAPEGRTVEFLLSQRDISDFRGQKNENLAFLTERFGLKGIRTAGSPDYPRGWLTLRSDGRTAVLHRTGLIATLS